MSRRFSLYLILCFSFFAVVQNLVGQTSTDSATSSTRVQVVYVIQGNTILTYNVDPQTFNATQVGSLTVNNTGVAYYGLYSSPERSLYLSHRIQYQSEHTPLGVSDGRNWSAASSVHPGTQFQWFY